MSTTSGATWQYGGHTYVLYKELKTWDAASLFANQLGGYLVNIGSAAENSSVYDNVLKNFTMSDYLTSYADDGGGSAYVWLGASDSAKEGDWRWSKDNSILSTVLGSSNTFWGTGPGHAILGQAGEPDNYTEPSVFPQGQDYLAMGIEAWPYVDYSEYGGPGRGSLGIAGQWNDVAGYRFSGSSGLYFVVEFGTATDTAAPLLSSISPLDSATGVAVGSNFVLNFNETVKAGTGSFVIKSGSATIGTIAATDSSQVTFNGSTVTINPANDLAFDTSYTVTATSDVIKDSAGNNWAGTGSNPYDFTTVAKTINGTSGHDNLVGTSGNDDIYGLEGDDTLNGGAGTDKLVGGAGNDTYVVDSTTDTILESTSAGKDVVQSSVNYALGANLENLTLTGTSAINGTGNTLDNTLTGNSGANSLSGGNGNDTLIGGSGNDTLDGGAGSFADTMDGGTGIDTLSYASLTSTLSAGVTLNLGRTKDSGGYVSASGLGGVDKVKGMENILGSAYADVFTGDSTANTLNGGAGNDTLDGGAGSFADTMDGGTGIDTVSYASLTSTLSAGVTLNLGGAKDSGGYVSASGLGGVDKVKGVENILGSAYADVLTGDSAANTLNGGAGHDSLIGGAGNDSLIGGLGNDTLNGGTGADTMTGGSGNDAYFVDAATDVIIESVSDNTLDQEKFSMGNNNDVVIASVSYTLAANVAVEDMLAASFLTGANTNDVINLTGNDLGQGLIGNDAVNTLTGNGGDDGLFGMGGNDTLIGGAGDDFLFGGDGDDIMNGGLGKDSFFFNFGASSGTNFVGQQGSAFMTGGKDTIDGGDGSEDTLILTGSLSDYTLTKVTATEYKISAKALLVGATVLETATFTNVERLGFISSLDDLDNGIGTVTLISTLPIGSASNDTLNGGTGNDSIDGAAGNDSLNGGAGNDTLDGGAGSFADTMDGGTGIDTVSYASLTSTLSAGVTLNLGGAKDSGGYVSASGLGGVDKVKGVENILGSAYADVLTGDSAANTLNGGAGHDSLIGGSGNDSLIGGAGNDTLVGGLGNDTLSGGTGRDVFVFNSATAKNVDTILDFVSGTDKIHLSQSVFAISGATGNLSNNAFWAAAGAVKGNDANDRVVFNTTTGALYYDADGSGSVAAVQIALLGSSASTAFSDFVLIA